jgi:hypothetical protein
VQIKSAQKNLTLRLIIKSIAQMNAAVLQQIGVLWKNIMRRRLFAMGHTEHVNAAID